MKKKNVAARITMMKTITVVINVSLRLGHVTFWNSWRTSRKNCIGDVFAMFFTFLLSLWSKLSAY